MEGMEITRQKTWHIASLSMTGLAVVPCVVSRLTNFGKMLLPSGCIVTPFLWRLWKESAFLCLQTQQSNQEKARGIWYIGYVMRRVTAERQLECCRSRATHPRPLHLTVETAMMRKVL